MDVCTLSCPALCNPMDCSPPSSSVHRLPGKNTGMGCHFLLQGIFPTRDWTQVSCISCIGKWILYLCTTWEAPTHWFKLKKLLILMSNCSRRLYTKNKGTPSSLISHRTALVTASYELILAGTFHVFIYSFPHPRIELYLILHYFAHSFLNLMIWHLSLTSFWKDSPHWF